MRIRKDLLDNFGRNRKDLARWLSYPVTMNDAPSETVIFGPFRLSPSSYSLSRRVPGQADQLVELRPKAFDVLCYLVENGGRTITADEFLSKLWPETYVQPEVLKGHVLAVRTALDDRNTPSRFIETVRGRGYRFIADTRRTWEDGSPRAMGNPSLSCVGREHIRDLLGGHLTQACAGSAQVAFVAGEAGIGKTTLTEAFLREAVVRGATIVTGRCLPGSGETDAYYPILEILTALGAGPIGNTLRSILGQHAPAWLLQLPGLVPTGFSHAQQSVLDATPHRMGRELCDALSVLARCRPVVILIEDIHWADQATLDLIQTLSNRKLSTKLLIVATFRTMGDGGAGHAANMMAQRLALYGLAGLLRLDPLLREDVQDFLNTLGHAPPDRLVDHLHERSEGNPLFMRAMLDALVQHGTVRCDDDGWHLADEFDSLAIKAPLSLTQIIEAEIGALPAGSRAVLEAASVTDGPFSPFINHPASGTNENNFETICEDLCRGAHLIRRSDVVDMPGGRSVQTYRFRHALYQEAAYDRQGPLARSRAHAAVANHIKLVYEEDLPSVASALARHYAIARQWPEAIAFLRMAARRNMQRFAHREAVAMLETAIHLCRHLPGNVSNPALLGALEELATIHLGVFDPRAVEVYERLTDLARDTGAVEIEARGYIGVGFAVSWTDSSRSLDLMRQALTLSGQITDPVQRARVRSSAQGWLNYIQGWSSEDAAGVFAQVEVLRDLGDPIALQLAHVYLSLTLFTSARYIQAVDTIGAAFSYLLSHGQESLVFGRAIVDLPAGDPLGPDVRRPAGRGSGRFCRRHCRL